MRARPTPRHGRTWRTVALRDDLLTELRRRRWVAVGEVRLRDRHPARADVLAMRRGNGEAGAAVVLRVFELKVGRGDLLADLRRGKWRAYLDVAPVVFALPEGLAETEEIPARAGLIVRGARGWRWVRPPAAGPARSPPADVMRRLAAAAADQAPARGRCAAAPLVLLGLVAVAAIAGPSRVHDAPRPAAASAASPGLDRVASLLGLRGGETTGTARPARLVRPRAMPAARPGAVEAARDGLLAWRDRASAEVARAAARGTGRMAGLAGRWRMRVDTEAGRAFRALETRVRVAWAEIRGAARSTSAGHGKGRGR